MILSKAKTEQQDVVRAEGKTAWRSPSNIAIIKYWGKLQGQVPMNPSVSMSLSESFTEAQIQFKLKGTESDSDFDFTFQGEPKPSFLPKINAFINEVHQLYPVLKNYSLQIDSRNSFPHSAGIASSASSMSALALCVHDVYQQVKGNNVAFKWDEVSNLARLGSGSAARSVFGGWTLWGEYSEVQGSSNNCAVSIQHNVHPVFQTLCDTILVVDESPKEKGSSEGHHLMNDHPYRAGRLKQVERNLKLLLAALKSGDFEIFTQVAEEEALSLHALMLSSNPGFILLAPETLKLIQLIRKFRSEEKIPVCFTLDAGPNLHLLYPLHVFHEVQNWIDTQVLPVIPKGKILNDNAGTGPVRNH
jgi:diphosphomevalonate decarboxylase